MRHLALVLLLPLAACTAPREACESRALGEVATLDALIAETRGNVARGYAIDRRVVRSSLTLCAPASDHFRFCSRTTPRVISRPQAIDTEQERRKLASLERSRARAAALAERRIAACRARYPGPA